MTPCQDDRSRYFSLDGMLVLLLHLYPVLALVGAAYLCFIVISGMTTEVFNLKYTTSLHAMMMASIYGTLLWNRPESLDS